MDLRIAREVHDNVEVMPFVIDHPHIRVSGAAGVGARRDQGFPEDRRRCRHEGNPRRVPSRRQRRRGRARHPGYHVGQGALHGDAAHGADTPDRVGTAANRHCRHEAGLT